MKDCISFRPLEGAEPYSAGIDVAIGVQKLTGLGLGPVIIREFVRRFVFVSPAVRAVITDPEERSVRSLHAFLKAGFKLVETIQLIGESRKRHVMRLDRP